MSVSRPSSVPAPSVPAPTDPTAPLVSVVIVSMNNPAMLALSLPSIQKHTSVPVEVFVVAYLFSPENLALVRKTYPWVTFIESNEIRGFAENNNLALRQTRGKYCFVVNDDTQWDFPVIDELVACFDRLPPEAAVVSPTILRADGTVQFCGRPPSSLLNSFLYDICRHRLPSRFTNQKGLFLTYNISGAAFMIETDAFREMGWFDERYFFCPEDVALSTKLNKNGRRCYVFEPLRLTHIRSGSTRGSKTMLATKAAFVRGTVLFWKEAKPLQIVPFVLWTLFTCSGRALAWLLRFLLTRDPHAKLMSKVNGVAIRAALSRKTPKELFLEQYGNPVQ